jgi:SAM-dependent methyltransferase
MDEVIGLPSSETSRVETRNCPLCEGQRAHGLSYQRDEWRIVQCERCSFVYMPEIPVLDEVGTTFEWSQSFAAETARRRKASPLLSRIDQWTRIRTRMFGRRTPINDVKRFIARGRVLDLGCGNGSYLASAGQGFELYGIDISPALTREADRLFRAHGGYAVCAPCTKGLELFEPNFFDAAILRSYLEHEPDPRGVLTNLFSALRPNGVAVIKVPNYVSWNRYLRGPKWCGFRFPDHVNYFTPATLRQMAEDIGYRVIIRWQDRLPTDDNVWAVLQRPA